MRTPVLLRSMGRCQNFLFNHLSRRSVVAVCTIARRARSWLVPIEWRLTQTPYNVSLLPFHESRCFAIERGTINLARFQIKFVDYNLNQCRSRHSEKYSGKPEEFGSRQG